MRGGLLVALHGAVANGNTWLPLRRELEPGIEVLTPDLPGHGSRASEGFSLSGALAMIAGLLDEARGHDVVLAGDSLGGYLALLAAARAPQALRGVVAGGCTWTMTGAWGALARASDVPVRLLARIAGDARVERAAAGILPRITDPETASAIADAGLRVAARSESLRELAGVDLVATVRAVRAPIVFVNGAYDWPTRMGERALLRAAPNARLVLAPHCGHGVGFFDAAVFAGAVEAAFAGDGTG